MPRLECKLELVVGLQPLGDPLFNLDQRKLIAFVIGDHHKTSALGRPTRHDLTLKPAALDMLEPGRPLIVDLAGLPLSGRTLGGELTLGRLRLGGYFPGASSPLSPATSGTFHPIASPTIFCVGASRLLYRFRCLS